MLPGRFAYSIGIWNPGPGSVKGPKIEFASTYPPRTLVTDTWWPGSHYSYSQKGNIYTYSWALPDILPETDESMWLGTGLGCKFSSGFDSSRDVVPTLLESATGIQEVRIRVLPTQQFSRLEVGISLEGSQYVKVELQKGSDRPLLDYSSNAWIQWRLDHPQANRAYQFKIKLRVTNLIFPSKVDSVPFMRVRAYESTHDYDWSGREWRSKTIDPDLLISNVTIAIPGTSQSTVELQTARTVEYLSVSPAQLKTTISLEGLPEHSLAGFHLVVDGAYARAEFTSAGSAAMYLREGGHEIRAPWTIEDSPGVRYYCERNTVSLSRSDVSSYLKAGSLSLTFNYVKQFRLQVYSWGDGNHTVKWLPPGSTVTVRASPFVVPSDVPLGLRPFSVAYRFQAWKGTIESKSPTVSLQLNQPTNMTAVWVPDYSPVIITDALILICTSLIGVLLASRRRKTMPAEKKPVSGTTLDTLLQRLETLKASGVISESAYERLRSEYEKRRGKD
jgi:hypothetical protein